MKNAISYLQVTIVSILLLIACKNNDKSSLTNEGLTNNEASEYISAFTQGMIKDSDPIEFRFLNAQQFDVASLQKAINISPSVKYTIELDEGKRGFKIIPNDKLVRGASYKVELQIDELFNTKGAKRLVSKLKVFEQFVKVQREGLVIDENNKSHIRINITTTLEESLDKIKALFDYPKNQITVDAISDKEFAIDLSFSPTSEHTKVNWDGKSIGAKEKGEIEVWNYDKDEFNVVNTYFDRNLNEYNVYFTKRLDQTQDAKGLIRIGTSDAEYQIQNNLIKVVLQSKTNEDITLSINRGIKAKDGSTLPLDLSYAIELAMVKPEIQWLADGSYIPVSGKFKIPFKAKALKSVVVSVVGIRSENASRYAAWNNLSAMDQMEMIRFGNLIYKSTYRLDSLSSNNLEEWNEFGLDMTNAFQREKGTIYHIELSYGPSNTVLQCEDSSIYEFEKETVDLNWFEDRYRYYRYYGYYEYSEQNNPCHLAYYLARSNISKTIHCTNVFPIIKKGEKEVQVAVKELLSEKLANGAKVDLISLQGLDIASAEVSNSGICVFRELDRKAKALRITYNGEISYFNLLEGVNNPLTEFDISSNVRDVDNRIFVYTERDVWRPGDTIFMDVMLNRAKFKFEEGLPIVIKLKNPKNVLYKKLLLPIHLDQSIYSFKMPTHLEAPTGYWRADIEIGPLKKSKSLRVETIKPNVVDLKYYCAGENGGWIYEEQIAGNLEVNYLAGYAMQNGRVSASANILPVNTPFDEYKNFVFQPLVRPDAVHDVKIWNVKTDKNGKSDFKFQQDFKQYAGVSKIVIDSKIDLPGGGLNTESESRIISPFTSYVGIKKSQGRGWRGSYRYGETPSIGLIHVDQKGKLISENVNVKLELYQYEKDWWYDRYRLSREHLSHSSYRYKKLWEKEIQLANGESTYVHDIKKNNSGMYKLKATDLKSGHVAEYEFHSIVSSDYSVQSNPVFIDLELEKNNYNVGEFIELKLPNLKEAKALISIERGSEVLEMFWHTLDDSSLQIPVQRDWHPNVYLHVSIVQNYGQENNDRPMRMYTVKKILVNQSDNNLQPEIIAAEKIEPNKVFDFSIKEEQGQAMEYTIALVDMGLLNLTGFQTPDPRTHFSKLMALRVETWDVFQQLLYYMNPSFAGIFSIGGDESTQKILDESADFNRFIPVVFHLGSFKLKANGKNNHTLSIPNYIGSLKLMVVACNDSSFGSDDKNIRVVSPLMIQSQLPRTLNVSDKVDVPISLFKDEASIDNVQLTAKASNELIQFSNPSLSTSLASDDQGLETISFMTGMIAGTTDISFEAKASSYKSFEETKIFINYPNSYSDVRDIFQIDKGGELMIPIESFGFDKTRNVDLQISGALVPNYTKQYNDLIQYPHGCLEQTTSKAIAMVFIDDLMAMTPEEKLKNRDFLDAAILKIQSFQQNDGRFNYWRNGYYHHWSDLYAGHFLIEARDKNLLFNDAALKNWITHKTKSANQWQIEGAASASLVEREEVLQAYRLFLLAKSGKPAKSAMNRFRKRELNPPLAKVFLSGAYYYTSMEDIGKKLLEEALTQGETDHIYGYSFGSPVRNKAIVVYTMSLYNHPRKDAYYADWVNEVNSSGWLSTQEKGFAFMACAEYFGVKQDISSEIDFELNSKLFNKRIKSPSNSQERFHWEWENLADEALVKNHGSSKIFVHKTQRAISNELYQEADQKGLNLTIQYSKLNGEALDLKNITQGEEIRISVSVKNTDILDQENLALTVKTPSGWELLNPRLYTTNEDVKARYIFQDFRDDKVYTYFNLPKNKSRSYQFRAKANLTGDYYLPAVRCENMYKGNIYAYSKATRAIIK